MTKTSQGLINKEGLDELKKLEESVRENGAVIARVKSELAINPGIFKNNSRVFVAT
jgi:hypothetical protein